jgi:preprotein translocase subunit SecG
MITIVVVIHLLVAVSMIGLILLQKTEGNASGGGFSASSNLSSMMQPRSRANPLSRATVVLGIAFFATSLGLALLSKQAGPAPSLFAAPAEAAKSAPKVDEIRTEPGAPVTETPAPALDAPAPTPAPTPAPAAPAGAPAVPTN